VRRTTGMPRTRILIALLIIAVPLLLTACGGGY
jgi:hypothetical protein